MVTGGGLEESTASGVTPAEAGARVGGRSVEGSIRLTTRLPRILCRFGTPKIAPVPIENSRWAPVSRVASHTCLRLLVDRSPARNLAICALRRFSPQNRHIRMVCCSHHVKKFRQNKALTGLGRIAKYATVIARLTMQLAAGLSEHAFCMMGLGMELGTFSEPVFAHEATG
jgi:hypothetical protein